MLALALSVLEEVMFLYCRLVAVLIRWTDRVLTLLAELFKFALVIFAFSALWAWIGSLPMPWQSWVLTTLLYSLAPIFPFVVILRIWKPGRLHKVFDL